MTNEQTSAVRTRDDLGGKIVGYVSAEHIVFLSQGSIVKSAPIFRAPMYGCDIPLYTHPANVAALEAEIAALKEAEQLARADAEASKARVEVLEKALSAAVSALEQVTDGERGGYNARNGKFVSLQMSDGERADIIHSDVTTECEGALETARAALTREGGV